MQMNSRTTYIVIGVVLVLVVIVIGVCWYRKSQAKTENFTGLAAGSVDNIGTLLDSQYDAVPAADYDLPAPHFADMVAENDVASVYQKPSSSNEDSIRPMERLHRIQGKSLMPRTSAAVTPFNIDVANPTSHKFMVNTPRVTTALKSRYKDYSLASFVRGDIPIKYYANVPLVAKTHQGRDDLRLDGLFTPHFVALYNKYTGKAYKNLVQHVAGAGQAGGYGGASGEIIMDSY